ncbi:NHS-like protein 3 isoform X1 [Gasterosteus aculeatus]
MSRRRSTGDLVPSDITEILAREARAQRGQKKPGSALGQAFSWLKGSRRKKNLNNELNRAAVGGTEGRLGVQNHDPAKAGPKGNEDQKRLTVHYRTSQHYQENVFIEGSRPQYLEDLHSEAQEGLKILQREEHTNGVNSPDDESVASTDTLRPEQDIGSKDGGGSPVSTSTAGSTDTTLTSAASSRPPLTRQGSTFKPLNPVKAQDKSRKRSRRTTIMGIPNQVQKELALHRSSTFQQLDSTPNHDGKLINSQSGVVTVPTVDVETPASHEEEPKVHLSELESTVEEQLLRKHLKAMFHDEQTSNHQGSGNCFCPTSIARPKSLAVPGTTTSFSLCPSAINRFLQEPQGPVMSISPQATYLSTIIPNAVLPASIEVIEIDLSSSRTRGSSVNQSGHIHTVSRSSLASGDLSVSPLLSRRSDGDGDNSHDESALMPLSALGFNWSESQSSKTVSNSSPVSSKGSTLSGNLRRVSLNGRESQTEKSSRDQDFVSLASSISIISSFSSKREDVGQGSKSVSGSVASGDDEKTTQNFNRSLSVMKTKQPPAPPRRTNSLHGNKISSKPKVLVDFNDSVSGDGANATERIVTKDEMKPIISTEGATEPQCSSSSPQKTSSEEGKFERTVSPSSGYSSQSGTPTFSPKGISPTSPDKQKMKPVKPERSVSRASSSAASPASSLTSLSSGTSDPVNPDVFTSGPTLPPQGLSPTTTAKDFTPDNKSQALGAEVRELLNLPPPPKVKAPCAPPPETWVHNRRTFEFLCGPCPNVSKVTQQQAQAQDSTVKQAGTQTEAIDEIGDQSVFGELSESKANLETLTGTGPDGVHEEIESRESSRTEEERKEVSADVQKQEQSNSPSVKGSKSPKKDPPPVLKKPVTVLNRKVSPEQSLDQRQRPESGSLKSDVCLVVENSSTSPERGVTLLADNSDEAMDKSEVTSTQTLSVEVPKVGKASPPPTPPPSYHPTPPPSRKTPPSSVSTPPGELHRVQEENPPGESSWPPPPPPMEGDSVFYGGEEVDFPPPPPPLPTDSEPDVMDSCVTELDVSKEHTEEVGEPAEDAGEAWTAVHGPIPDLSPAVSQTATDTSQAIVPSPPGAAHPSPSNTRAENPASVPPCSFLKHDAPTERPVSAQPPASVPVAPALPADNFPQGITFRRQPSVPNRDPRSKELLNRHKSAPIPKEDANIPLVTPSLLQMVRLRSVNMTEDQEKAPSEDKLVQENCSTSVPGPQTVPQKPIRKSLSMKSPQAVKTSSALHPPSMRLQEAIRMKTAAMSSRDGLPSRLGVRSSTYSSVSEQGSLKPPEGCDMHKSPASTASFIFSRGTKKVIFETTGASSPEAQAGLKQSLAAELTRVSDRSKCIANGGLKLDKVPPPVAKKPTNSPTQNLPACSTKTGFGVERKGAQHSGGTTLPETTTTRVTADTIETLF